ncbi:hypothetical protein QTO34_003052 [Cnephaeus nilssonii]|uniref:Uncharacterized protein n=1 Tax=Cnephaeus nilssonii TaxID=3371016 RepID=A0AA40HT77_CNENI|nr:hypothetical protein QTO34_003052 [Eptesicus nilssonii]
MDQTVGPQREGMLGAAEPKATAWGQAPTLKKAEGGGHSQGMGPWCRQKTGVGSQEKMSCRMFCKVKLSLLATRMQFSCRQAGYNIQGRLTFSNGSSQKELRRDLQIPLLCLGFGGAQMRPSCEAMQAAVGPWDFFWMFWVSLTQLQFVRHAHSIAHPEQGSFFWQGWRRPQPQDSNAQSPQPCQLLRASLRHRQALDAAAQPLRAGSRLRSMEPSGDVSGNPMETPDILSAVAVAGDGPATTVAHTSHEPGFWLSSAPPGGAGRSGRQRPRVQARRPQQQRQQPRTGRSGRLTWKREIPALSGPRRIRPLHNGDQPNDLKLLQIHKCIRDFCAHKEQCSQLGCQSVTSVTTMDPEKLLCPLTQKTESCPDDQQSGGRRKLKATQGTDVPTWSHLKKTTEAQQIVEKQEVEATSSTMFLLMLASVSCQSSAKSCAAKSKDSE